GEKTLSTACARARNAKKPRNPTSVSCWSFRRRRRPGSGSGPEAGVTGSRLHSAGGQPGDDAALEDEHHDDQRYGDQGAGGHDGGVGVLERARPREAGDGDGDRLGGGGGELAGEHEFVPRGDEREDRGGEQ